MIRVAGTLLCRLITRLCFLITAFCIDVVRFVDRFYQFLIVRDILYFVLIPQLFRQL